MKLAQLKTLLISAKNEVNSQLHLNKSKDIRYSEDHYLEEITFLSLFNCCAEDGSQTMDFIDDVPSGDALLQQIKKLEFESVEEQFHGLFERQFYKMFPKAKKGKKYRAIVIIDTHEQETYSREKRTNVNIIGGKHKNGTNFFFKYMTMQVLIRDKLITLGIKFRRKKEAQSRPVDELIMLAKKYVNIGVVLLDRGFRDVEILNNLEYRAAPVLMPMFKDEKGEKCLQELGRKNFKAIRYWFRNKKGEYADLKLLMIRLSNGKEIGFYTTLKNIWLHTANYYLDLYRKRWNIETGYRMQNMFLPRTTSINDVVRLFYFCYACAMHNLWMILRSKTELGKGLTVLRMKVILVVFWITTHLPKDW